MTLEEAKNLIAFAKSEGVRRFRFGELEIEFASHVIVPESDQERPKNEKKTQEEELTEEQMLFLSAGA